MSIDADPNVVPKMLCFSAILIVIVFLGLWQILIDIRSGVEKSIEKSVRKAMDDD